MKGIIPADIGTMLNDLGLSISALKWEEIQRSPELADFTPEQLLRVYAVENAQPNRLS